MLLTWLKILVSVSEISEKINQLAVTSFVVRMPFKKVTLFLSKQRTTQSFTFAPLTFYYSFHNLNIFKKKSNADNDPTIYAHSSIGQFHSPA